MYEVLRSGGRKPAEFNTFKIKNQKSKIQNPTSTQIADKEGGWLQNGVDKSINCEIFGTHVIFASITGFMLDLRIPKA